jgi:hypothetical protein
MNIIILKLSYSMMYIDWQTFMKRMSTHTYNLNNTNQYILATSSKVENQVSIHDTPEHSIPMTQ